MKAKLKSKWLLITAVVVLCTSILIAIPMYANRENMRTRADEPFCPPGEVPKCPFEKDDGFAVFFPHPNDCHFFFHCSDGVAYCKECPADLHWNVELETCDYPYRAGCQEEDDGDNG